MKKDILIVLTVSIVVLIVGYVITDTALRYAPQENTRRTHAAVYTVCKMSNEVYSRELEEACDRVQYATNTEFLCNYKTNALTCWVEDK